MFKLKDLLTVALYAHSVAFLAVHFNDCTYGQEAVEGREIETDRDSFTPALTTVSREKLLVESAWSYIDNKGVADTHSLPELLLRYGWTDQVELRFGTNYEIGGEASDVSTNSGFSELPDSGGLHEESKVTYGVKTALTSQSGWRPQSAITLAGATPTSGEESASSLISSYVIGWELANRLTIASALRYGTGVAEEDHFNSWAPSTVIKMPIWERASVHAEYFGDSSDGKDKEFVRHFFSPGIHYLVSSNLEVGLRTGWGLNEQSANFFSNIGFGWQY